MDEIHSYDLMDTYSLLYELRKKHGFSYRHVDEEMLERVAIALTRLRVNLIHRWRVDDPGSEGLDEVALCLADLMSRPAK